MRYSEPPRDDGRQVTQHYTGVGEVMGVLELDRFFQQQFGRQFRAKRGGLFTLDDALSNNLIFVGSPTENLTLKKIPLAQGFVFRQASIGANCGNQVIVDLHPEPGAPAAYLPTPNARPLEMDYAVISLRHGLDPSRWTLILAGITTVGTRRPSIMFATTPLLKNCCTS